MELFNHDGDFYWKEFRHFSTGVKNIMQTCIYIYYYIYIYIYAYLLHNWDQGELEKEMEEETFVLT